jgi:rubrerythrin
MIVIAPRSGWLPSARRYGPVSEDRALEVLKRAILLERQGKAFYEQVSRQSQSPAVSRFFLTMAEEENQHIEALSKQFSGYAAGGTFGEATLDGPAGNIVSSVLSSKVRREISAAGYEAAAISAAIEMENRAVALYSERAESSKDTHERDLYRWLARWERGHLKLLAEINDDLIEEIWNENNFWPF